MEVDQRDRETYKEKVNKDILPKRIEDSVQKIIKNEGYKDYKVVIKAITTEGGNYLGDLYEVDVTGKTEDCEKETNLFIKRMIPNDRFTIFSMSELFEMELFIYNELSVVLKELQEEAGVPECERYSMAKSYQESIPEAIILENVTRKGYKTLFRMDPIPLKFTQMAIQQLGRLHALSFALEKKRPDYFDRKIKCLSYPMSFNEEYRGLLDNSSKAISAHLDDDAKRRLTNIIPKLWENIQRYYCDDKYRRTIAHGDYRANNILVKEIDGEVTDVLPVDYQLVYYGCPMLDFMWFIFVGTDQKFRKNHLKDLKDMYFESLTKMLKHFDIEVKSVFPREEFEDLYNEVLDYGLTCFIQLMPFVFAAEDGIIELDKDNLADVVIKTDKRMAERARGIVDDFIQWGIL